MPLVSTLLALPLDPLLFSMGIKALCDLRRVFCNPIEESLMLQVTYLLVLAGVKLLESQSYHPFPWIGAGGQMPLLLHAMSEQTASPPEVGCFKHEGQDCEHDHR
jgi:hypothetical protein